MDEHYCVYGDVRNFLVMQRFPVTITENGEYKIKRSELKKELERYAERNGLGTERSEMISLDFRLKKLINWKMINFDRDSQVNIDIDLFITLITANTDEYFTNIEWV